MPRFQGIAIEQEKAPRFGGVPVEEKEQEDYSAEFQSGLKETAKTEWKEALGSAISNFPESLVKDYFDPMVSAVRHPVKTAKGVAKLTVGGAQKLIPGQQSEEIAEAEQTWDNMIEHFKSEYGSVEGFKKTLAEKPAQVLGDALTVVTLGAGAAGRAPGIVGRVGKTVQRGAAALEPVRAVSPVSRGAGKLLVKGLEKLPGGSANEIYKSAAKFTGKMTRQEEAALAETALKYKIPTSVGGLIKAEGLIRKWRETADNIIDEAIKGGRTGEIPVKRLLQRFPEMEAKEALRALPKDARRAFNRVRSQIMDEFKNKPYITIEEAQTMKQNIYKDIESFYTQTKRSPVSIKAQKEVASQLKKGIEFFIPEIKNVNKKWGEVIDLENAMTKVSKRISHRDIMGIGVPAKVIAGKVAAGTGGSIMGLAISLLDVPTIKSRIAILLRKMDKQGILKESSKAAAIRLGLYEAGRTSGAGGEF